METIFLIFLLKLKFPNLRNNIIMNTKFIEIALSTSYESVKVITIKFFLISTLIILKIYGRA